MRSVTAATSRPGRRVRAAALAVAALAVAPAAAAAQEEGPRSLTLTPSRAEGVGDRGTTVGPFRLINGTPVGFAVRVVPTLLDQRRDGAIVPRDDRTSLDRASRLLALDRRRFDFPRGSRERVSARIKRLTSDRNLYGGVLFEARPERAAQITQVSRLTASLFIMPAPRLRRVRLGAARMIARQGEGRAIEILTPLRNRGNIHVQPVGRLRVRDSSGRVVARASIRPSFPVLPDAIVDLPATVRARLGPGVYALAATVRGRGRTVTARGEMRLVGENEVEVRDGEIQELPEPEFVRGEPIDIGAIWRNTGNVAFTPVARVEGRAPGGEESLLDQPLGAERAGPGERGRVAGQVQPPAGADELELTLRLRDGGRLLAEKSVVARARAERSRIESVWEDVKQGAGPILLGLAALAVAALLLLLGRRRSRKTVEGRTIDSRTPPPAPAPRHADRPPRPPPPEEPLARPTAEKVVPAGLEPSDPVDAAAARLRDAQERLRNAEQRIEHADRARAEVVASADLAQPAARAPVETRPEPGPPPRLEPAPHRGRESPPRPEPEPEPAGEDGSDLNSLDLSQLRGLGLSVTQARRLIAHRERVGGIRSLDELAALPGFPPSLLERMRRRARP